MRISDYPPQEAFTAIGERYHEEVLSRAGNVPGEDISYGADAYQSLCVYSAAEPNGDVLCFMHGGGWTNGYKEWMAFMAPAITGRGVTFVSLGYRLAPAHVFPKGFDDCCDGIAGVYEHVARFGGDGNRIFVGGHSAGAHYASLLALRADWQSPRNLPTDVIKGALPVSGTYSFGPGSGLSMRPRFLGPEENGADEAASPTTHVHKSAPPFLISYGEEDFPHLVRQAGEFADLLKRASVGVQVMQLAGCDHLGASYATGDVDGVWIKGARDFMSSMQ